MAAGIGLEHIGVVTDDTLMAQSLHQSVFKLVGDQIATLGINTHLQGVTNLIGNGFLGTGHIPEGILIGIGGTTGLGVGLGVAGLLGQRLAGGSVHLTVNGLLAFQTGDLLAQVGDFLLHAGVGGIVLCGQNAIGVAVGIQECLGGLPGLGALNAQFVDSHSCYLQKFNISAD